MGLVSHRRLKVLLNTHSFFSFGAGASSPQALVQRAAALGYHYLALTDDHGVYGAAELSRAGKAYGVKPLYGVTVFLELEGEAYPLVLLAASRKGYATMNELLSVHHEGDKTTILPVLLAHTEDLFCLTGPRRGFLTRYLAERKVKKAEELLLALKGAFKNRLFVQLYHDLFPGDARRVRILRALARDLSLPVVFAPEVRYAVPELYPLYDALVCARLGISVDKPHSLRPRNAAQFLLSPEEAAARVPFPEAIANAEAIAGEASFDLLPDRLTPPAARVPAGLTPEQHLEERCHAALLERYGGERFTAARARLDEELSTVKALGLAGFFLVAAEVSDYCKSRGILSAGRGSAAASVVCYLLGITKADPIAYGLLFERFLHTGKAALPDVDIDIGSARRDEVIAWVEERFGSRTEAMTANRITYRLPSAVQDLGRALGLPPMLRDRLGKALGRNYRHLRPHRAREAEEAFSEVLGAAPVKEMLLSLLEKVEPGFVRHLAPHSGGVVLSKVPITHYSPLERSSGGIRLLQFDKDDIESLGLIKLDLLGLRMLSALERAREEIHRTTGLWYDLADLPDDPEVWRLIATGGTMGLFQIESPGQTRLSVQLKPRNLEELAHQVALFRPGPIQSGTVHPYLRRRQGKEPVTYLHPSLEPILARTQGVILFQEQVLRIAVHFAGMSWAEADRFRKEVSSFEETGDLEPHRQRFIDGAGRTVGASREEADKVFGAIGSFQGYGFAESHAWAFALHAYASAWLRLHYPAEYLSAVLTEAPGMWSASTMRQEARAWGVSFLKLDINVSSVSYRCDLEDGVKAVLPPLTAVEGVSEETAREICLDRLEHGPYGSVDDLYSRVRLRRQTFEALARAGAFDRLHNRREALYRFETLYHSQRAGERPLFSAVPDIPPLKKQAVAERFSWDYELKGFTEHEIHPLDMMRLRLREYGAVNLALAVKRPSVVLTAGLVVARQKPPTARGFAFFVLEDGSLRVQLIIPPDVWERYTLVLRDANVLLVEGELQGRDGDRALKAGRVWGVPILGNQG